MEVLVNINEAIQPWYSTITIFSSLFGYFLVISGLASAYVSNQSSKTGALILSLITVIAGSFLIMIQKFADTTSSTILGVGVRSSLNYGQPESTELEPIYRVAIQMSFNLIMLIGLGAILLGLLRWPSAVKQRLPLGPIIGFLFFGAIAMSLDEFIRITAQLATDESKDLILQLLPPAA